MTLSFRVASLPFQCRPARLFLRLSGLLLICVLSLAQQASAQQVSVDEQIPVGEVEAIDTSPPDTHANRQAPQDLLIMAAHEPQRLVGKTLILNDGLDGITVGPVTDVRRRLQDDALYVIVDASTFFKTPTMYAVAVKDLDKLEGDTLIIPEVAGMHLRGLDYYADDYTDTDDNTVAETAEQP